ncbi:MAG: DNA primase small subunit PriS [Candidatus Bathyarchaeia archaeon]
MDERKRILAISFAKGKFGEYYARRPSQLRPPSRLASREFGFLFFGEKFMLRHKGFSSEEELIAFLRERVPSDAYHSTAIYMDPGAEMERKGWLGADLCFDIDADHLEAPCKFEHDRWACACGETGAGPAPRACPKCGAEGLKEEAWMCESCLERAKDELMKLMEVLNSDFGIAQSEMSAYFSGHRGYHLHVRSEEVLKLGESERREIVDYLMGIGMDPSVHGFAISGGAPAPSPLSPGWGGRLSKAISEILARFDYEGLKAIGLTPKAIKAIVEERDPLLRDWLEGGGWGLRRRVGSKGWGAILRGAIRLASVNIDAVVTTDLHRLIRLPGSLNGKTGLIVMPLEVDEMEDFEPFIDAAAFNGEEKIHVIEAPKLRLGGESFGPYEDETVSLPTSAALLLVCKGKAYPAVD